MKKLMCMLVIGILSLSMFTACSKNISVEGKIYQMTQVVSTIEEDVEVEDVVEDAVKLDFKKEGVLIVTVGEYTQEGTYTQKNEEVSCSIDGNNMLLYVSEDTLIDKQGDGFLVYEEVK